LIAQIGYDAQSLISCVIQLFVINNYSVVHTVYLDICLPTPVSKVHDPKILLIFLSPSPTTPCFISLSKNNPKSCVLTMHVHHPYFSKVCLPFLPFFPFKPLPSPSSFSLTTALGFALAPVDVELFPLHAFVGIDVPSSQRTLP
jgi:hypothetical protein